MDELGTDAAPPNRRRRALVVLVVLLLIAGLAGDRWARHRELDALLDRVAVAEQAVRASQSSLASLAGYQSALLVRADVPPSARASAYANLARDAARWAPRVAAARSDVAASLVLPWHRELRAAREAYVERTDAWTGLLTRLEDNPTDGLSGQREVASAAERARRALQALAPGDERIAGLGG